jgi:hypothetical protein
VAPSPLARLPFWHFAPFPSSLPASWSADQRIADRWPPRFAAASEQAFERANGAGRQRREARGPSALTDGEERRNHNAGKQQCNANASETRAKVSKENVTHTSHRHQEVRCMKFATSSAAPSV